MTEIEQKALTLVNEIEREEGLSDLTPKIMRGLIMDEALCRAIEQHEQFKREVSDAVEASMLSVEAEHRLRRFILPKPVDPLVEVMQDCGFIDIGTAVDDIRAALAKRGLEVREIDG